MNTPILQHRVEEFGFISIQTVVKITIFIEFVKFEVLS